ncbi:MAG: hypothetical protein ACYTX0_56455, partial [Nostoc sp.]
MLVSNVVDKVVGSIRMTAILNKSLKIRFILWNLEESLSKYFQKNVAATAPLYRLNGCCRALHVRY